jgi:uracil-DNA glycosylase family 4
MVRFAMRDKDPSSGLLELLAWYREMGVDEAVAATATAWLEQGDRPQAAAATAAPARRPPQPPPLAATDPQLAPEPNPAPFRRFAGAAPDAAVMAARNAARQAADLDALAASLARFEGCSLKATAKNLCFYRGLARAPVMLIGEAPGREEDLEGKPFVGRAGQLLDKMLAAIGLSEQQVHITNIVYWRPPGNRTPTPQEAQVCRPFLERQVALVAPELLVLLGGAAAKHLLGVTDGIMRMRGKLRDVAIGGRNIPAIATLHPAYLLRTPAAKRLAWRDLLLVKAALAGTPAASP